MAIVFTTGNTYTSGDTVTATNLNNVVNAMTLRLATDMLLGRITAGTGNVEEVTCTDLAQSLLDDTTTTAMRTTLGVLGSNLESNFASAVNVTQMGSLGGDVIFNAANAPTVTLTAGTWVLLGSVTARTNDVGDTLYARFYNSDTATTFGGGAAQQLVSGALNRSSLNVVGFYTAPSPHVIFFKVFRSGSSTLDVGSAGAGPTAGYMIAIRLTT